MNIQLTLGQGEQSQPSIGLCPVQSQATNRPSSHPARALRTRPTSCALSTPPSSGSDWRRRCPALLLLVWTDVATATASGQVRPVRNNFAISSNKPLQTRSQPFSRLRLSGGHRTLAPSRVALALSCMELTSHALLLSFLLGLCLVLLLVQGRQPAASLRLKMQGSGWRPR